MNASVVALAFISVIVFLGAFIGFYAGTRRKMDLEQWTVGDRGFGMLLVWLLMAGEVYTTFTFLGASGWAYSKGAPVLYVLGYQPLMYVVSFTCGTTTNILRRLLLWWGSSSSFLICSCS